MALNGGYGSEPDWPLRVGCGRPRRATIPLFQSAYYANPATASRPNPVAHPALPIPESCHYVPPPLDSRFFLFCRKTGSALLGSGKKAKSAKDEDIRRPWEQEMNRTERFRRVALLMASFLRNLAYLRAFKDVHARIPMDWTRDFWITQGGNCTDIAVLEWCKLFADRADKHHWSRIVADLDAFKPSLLARLGMEEAAYSDYVTSVRRYRDKFVAHLDSDNVMDIPMLDIAERAVFFYHQHLTTQEVSDPLQVFRPLPSSSAELTLYFEHHCRAAAHTYNEVLPPLRTI